MWDQCKWWTIIDGTL